MSDPCTVCGHERALNRCWRLTCPENGGSVKLLRIVDDACRYGISITKDGKRVDPNDFYVEPPPKLL